MSLRIPGIPASRPNAKTVQKAVRSHTYWSRKIPGNKGAKLTKEQLTVLASIADHGNVSVSFLVLAALLHTAKPEVKKVVNSPMKPVAPPKIKVFGR